MGGLIASKSVLLMTSAKSQIARESQLVYHVMNAIKIAAPHVSINLVEIDFVSKTKPVKVSQFYQKPQLIHVIVPLVCAVLF